MTMMMMVNRELHNINLLLKPAVPLIGVAMSRRVGHSESCFQVVGNWPDITQ